MKRINHIIENFVLWLVVSVVIILGIAFTFRSYGMINYDLFMDVVNASMFLLAMTVIPLVRMGLELWPYRPEVLRVWAALVSIILIWVAIVHPYLVIVVIALTLSVVLQLMILSSLFRSTTIRPLIKYLLLVLSLLFTPVYLSWAIYEAWVTRPYK